MSPGLGPLIKWPGGKTRELGRLEGRWPAGLVRWVEPFVGGGAAYFDQAPRQGAINDLHRPLIGLYRAVAARDPELRAALERLAVAWDRKLGDGLDADLSPLVSWFRDEGRKPGAAPPGRALPALGSRVASRLGLGPEDGIEPQELAEAIRASCADKLRRLYRLEAKHATRFDDDLLLRQLETAVRSGVYTLLRDSPGTGSRVEEIARFVFQREFCYGSMFRYNRQGRFNIPYGGMAYNTKRLASRVADLFSPARTALLAGHVIENRDFRDFLDRQVDRLDERTLVFFDPPYDSDFHEYGGSPFGYRDQCDLARRIARLPCHVVAIVKETPRVRELYREAVGARPSGLPPLAIESYSKRYGYNVRGRNDRDTTHLLVHTLGPG